MTQPAALGDGGGRVASSGPTVDWYSGKEPPKQVLRAVAAYQWRLWGRPEQLDPRTGETTWLYMAGRGAGKTRAGAEWARDMARRNPGSIGHLIGPTSADVRDVMLTGPSGLLTISPPWDRPLYEPSKRRLTWANGSTALLFSAEEPDRLRGPQCHWLWADEIAAWDRPETWDMAAFGLRLGKRPRACATSTPKPVRLVRDLLKSDDVVVTRGTTMSNAANLAPAFIKTIIARYEGTRLYRQEVLGEYLEEAEGALWARGMFQRLERSELPELDRIVVAIDPAVTADADSDETGIVVCGTQGRHGYLLGDLSGHYSPDTWARKVRETFHAEQADRIIGEVNNGGDLIRHTLHVLDSSLPFKAVHASKSKRARAEPVAALYEQGRVYHVGDFPDLEDQLCTWEPNSGLRSPDRLDALVWGLTELMVSPGAGWDDALAMMGAA